MPGKTVMPATFESADFYSDQRYDLMMGIDKIHPLVRIRDFVRNYGFQNYFLIDDFVNVSSLPADQAVRFLMWMSAEGFLIYNNSSGKVLVKERLYNYLDAKVKKRKTLMLSTLSLNNLRTTKTHYLT